MDDAVKEAVGVISAETFLIVLFMGVVGERVYGLIHPAGDRDLKDRLYELAFMGLFSAAIALPLAEWIKPQVPAHWYQPIFAVLVLAMPTLLVIGGIWLRREFARRNLILKPHPTPWDAVFMERKEMWVVVHLKDGRRIGGSYGKGAYASLNPNPGHLYLNELWELGPNNAFIRAVPQSKGAIFRPEDYTLIEFYH